MKNKLGWLLSLLIVLSMLLSACGGAATPTVEVMEPVATTEVVVEPSEEPEATPVPEVKEATGAQLDAAFSTFLSGMEAYDTVKMDAFSEMMVSQSAPFVLDVREVSEVEENGYIEGAVHIPLRELAKNLDKLPSFDTPIVSYCASGWRCTIASTLLSALGWENVKSLKDNSYTGWVDAGNATVAGLPAEAPSLNEATPDASLVKTIDKALASLPKGWGVITAEELATALAENPELLVIDVRTQKEVDENGSIEGSSLIPLESFIAQKSNWPADKNAPIVIYCGSGHRSTIAMAMLYSYGYTDVRSMKGGFGAWVEGGFPVAGGTASAPAGASLDEGFQSFIGSMVKYNTMGLDELNALLAEEPPPFVLDVREPGEVEEKGHIEGAVHIPLRELAKNLDKLPSFDTPIVSYCASGWRCTIAMTALGALGWEDVKSLKDNSYTGWVEAGYATLPGFPPEAEALNAATPDPALVSVIDQALSAVPENFGVITVEDLATALTENPELIVIDVRTEAERSEKGVIEAENEIAIPLEEFMADMDQWPADKDAKIVVYCGSGHRSTIAMTILWSYGYTNVSSMKGGFGAWVEAGFPVAEFVAQ